MRREARYPGGPYPFGYEPYQDGAYWYLRPHPVYAKEVEQMALALVSGKAAVSIAADLNARGIPTVKAQQAKPGKTYTWTAETVRHILSGDQIRGYVMHSPGWRKVPSVRVVGQMGSSSAASRSSTTNSGSRCKRLIEGDDHTATLKRIGMQIADLTTQHYVNNGVPDFHTRMAELEAEHARVSALPREKPKVRRIATGKTFRQRWEETDNEQRHAYLKSTAVPALVVRNEDFTVSMVSEQGTQAADDVVLDIPMNVITEVGDKWVVSIGLGTLREQLQHVEAI
jgi:hypothetical protein